MPGHPNGRPARPGGYNLDVELLYRRGLHLPELDLWLDPHEGRAAAVVSHAHADHVRRHRLTFATDSTRLLIEHVGKSGACTITVPFGRRTPFGDGYLTLLPAGHVLGSAQVLVERAGHRLLYSGDLKLRSSLTAEPAEVRRADTLVVESTYGRPQYNFPPAEEVFGRLEQFCVDALTAGETPVVFAYSLGKSQEVLAGLARRGLRFGVHPTIAAVCSIYERCGVALPPYEVFQGGDADGRVLLLPPHARRGAALSAIERIRTASVTGWALDRGAVYRLRCDAAFPLSDHAGYPELFEYVERVAPSRIYTVHGFARDLAHDLRARGFRAYSLTQPEQLPLF